MRFNRLSSASLVALAFCSVAGAQSIGTDDFQAAVLGALPACPWRDVGLVDITLPNPPDPSAVVITTTDAFGAMTQALHIVDSIAPSQGIYALVPVSSEYSVAADVRVDRYSDNSRFPAGDWAMEVGIGKLDGTLDLAFTPQVGIYASSLTHGWRLYAVGTSYTASADIDLELPATIGVWYRVQVDLVAATGSVRSRVWNKATDELLVDRIDVVPLWTPADGIFDRLMVLDGETSEATTISNLATVDNVVFNSAPPIPPGPLGDLNGDGAVNAADLAILLGSWTG
ncbi:MAG: hypothetical protein SGJ09_02200 [Phycisphaerae bacterium]|nr:hypothetical protein [Phycisphaerae bacterium]